MKFAPVLPAELYPLLDFGDYHFVQAHNVRGREHIFEWLERVANQGHTIIVDNGVIELGFPDIESTLELASMVRKCIIVCPDKFCDYGVTIELAKSWAANCFDVASSVMLVPHGNDVVDWLCCAEELLRIANGIRNTRGRVVIGVPKVLDSYEAMGRANAIGQLSQVFPERRMHLLGVNNSLDDVRETSRRFPELMGYDSTLPIALGLNHLALHMQSPKCGIDVGDFEMYASALDTNAYELTKINIEFARSIGNPRELTEIEYRRLTEGEWK